MKPGDSMKVERVKPGDMTIGVETDSGWRSYDAIILVGCSPGVVRHRMAEARRKLRHRNRRGTRAQRRLKRTRWEQEERAFYRTGCQPDEG